MKKSEKGGVAREGGAERENERHKRIDGKRARKKNAEERNIRLLPLGVEVGRRFAFYGDVLCKRVREEVVGWRGW